MWPKPPETVAAVDLGSNSFHMIVANLQNGEWHTVDRLREMVRLAAGLDDKQCISGDTRERALDCLERFGQRVRNLPPGGVRAVGTNTLRKARNANRFLRDAEAALGHPIDIISGIEEARLIYLGVSQSLACDDKRRLVIDIGGGSTELIIGAESTPLRKESLEMGCVSMSVRFFGDGKLSSKRFNRAVLTARRQLLPFYRGFRKHGWDEAVGASGTMRAVNKVLRESGWSKSGITQDGLDQLVDAMLAAGNVDKLELETLNPERAPVFPGGVAVLCAIFQTLKIESMRVSNGALREGLLYDLLGRLYDHDVRTHSVNALATRYHVDKDQAARIATTLHAFLEQVELDGPPDKSTARLWLDWAAQLVEIGFDIAHNQYHKHGAYIIENADLAGFSRQEQKLLATLVRSHRRKFGRKLFEELAAPWNNAAPKLALLLRLAVLLHRSRDSGPLPKFRIKMGKGSISIKCPDNWLEENPLTRAGLEQEAEYLKAATIKFKFA